MGSFEMKSSASSSEKTEPPKRLTNRQRSVSRFQYRTWKSPRLPLRRSFATGTPVSLDGQDVTGVILADGHAASLLSVECLDPALHEVEDDRAFDRPDRGESAQWPRFC